MLRRLMPLLCFLFLLFSFLPTIYELANRDKLSEVRAFELIHNFPTDYNFYLSRIREGIEGRTAVVEKYTSEPHKGSFIHVFYLILGLIGRWVRVPWERAGDIYHVARIVFGLTLLFLIAEFAKRSFPNALGGARFRFWQLLAFLLAVTASTWPKLASVNGTWRFGGYMAWWSVMDSLQRITFIPHLLVGQALVLFLIMAVTDSETMKNGGNWIFLGILSFALGLILPPGLLMFYVALGFLILIGLIRALIIKKENLLIALERSVGPKLIVAVLGLPALLYLQLMTSFYPWKRLTEFDILHPLPFNYLEYIKALGPILPFGLLGLVVALKNREKIMAAAGVWVLGWASLLGVFHFVPEQSPLRFSEMIPHVPLGILATYFFYNFYKHYIGYKRYIFLFFPLILVGLGATVMWSSFFWQRDFVDHKIWATVPLVPTGSYVMYPLKDWLSAMKFLQDATTRDTVILSETTAGNYLPVYSGNTVYVGHDNTVNATEKEAKVKAFFAGAMSESAARDWLTRENLHYIFFGPQEEEDGGIKNLTKAYPFLDKIYKNNFVSVYYVR